ncbi:hypothetical protein IU436_27380 [Nocardia farcinica]|uniref:hypothetical protein n=1 Tax=Nocardia TaxID=1817 RepID=UPI001895D098|nr:MULTISPECIES: hypothetical protein [Nocardia]MBF6215666.1 hypothetical protein [Nocardia puris]MBF6422363.1 hypothetical protein [Nocardia farcinica]MBF6434064.1 hypothetical protein [Nocardia farcinica]MBF6505120.1 hypothetical protein [Nocardia farcinica]
MTYTRIRVTVTAFTLAAAATAAAACGGGDGSRPAQSVSNSTSGTVVTGNDTDLGSIVIGLGSEITTPKAEDIDARCTGRGDDLAVEITAPQGWRITAHNPSQTLTVENTEKNLAGDLDTTNRYLEALKAVDWSETDQLDIAATAEAPAHWQASDRNVYISLHVDCR